MFQHQAPKRNRKSVEQLEAAGHGQPRNHKARPVEKTGAGPFARDAKEARTHPLILSTAVHRVCGMSLDYFETLSKIIVLLGVFRPPISQVPLGTVFIFVVLHEEINIFFFFTALVPQCDLF